MDFNLKQWRDQQVESEEEEQQQPSAKIPKLFLETPQNQHQYQQQETETALPLFLSSSASESQPNKHFSTFPTTTTPRFPRVGGGGGYCFSITQWQELELQALIYKHMVAGAQVPQELLQLVKKSLFTSSASSYYNLNLHHFPPHFQPLVEAGYWGKGAMDPEPGRCRRTDGKKWRCSRDVVVGHKYCERHVHRGKNRSRKPVEFPPPSSSAAGGGGGGSVAKSSATAAFAGGSSGGSGGGGGQFSLSGSGASFDAFQLNQGSSELLSSSSDKKALLAPQHGLQSKNGKSSSSSSNNKVLMHFFDDWPRSLQETDNNGETNGNPSSSTSLSISSTGNPTSDFLRLSTGNGIELTQRDGNGSGNGNEERERGQLSWNSIGWGANPVTSMGMGGPLAEALRSSTHSSPTSVLH